MSKIIFLDVDGVLITDFKKGLKADFNENCVGLLQYIIDKTDAKIVISSSWRHHLGALKKKWEKAGLEWDLIIGTTPSRTNHGRDGEIMQWIEWNLERFIPLDWIAIDDENFEMDKTDLLGKLVKTESKIGLTRKYAELAITKLNN